MSATGSSQDPVGNSTVVAPMSEADQIKDKIAKLSDSLQKQLPSYESLLHTIHMNLAKSPDTVHLLTDQEIGIICAGLSKKTNVIIAPKEAKKSLKGTKLEDL